MIREVLNFTHMSVCSGTHSNHLLVLACGVACSRELNTYKSVSVTALMPRPSVCPKQVMSSHVLCFPSGSPAAQTLFKVLFGKIQQFKQVNILLCVCVYVCPNL